MTHPFAVDLVCVAVSLFFYFFRRKEKLSWGGFFFFSIQWQKQLLYLASETGYDLLGGKLQEGFPTHNSDSE
jgi:hypothetical protein